ncbi:MAG: hypothetical protein E2P03_08255 [Acidobacteria bacterium]|nr:MAG: hypothetical protein E2P03_08255 [Acidobacteriota bacterium]
MGTKAEKAPADLVKRHLKDLGRLPLGPLFYDRTAQVDLRLVEIGAPELANELAMLEERMITVAEAMGPEVGQPGGVGKILEKEKGLQSQLADLLARFLPLLGHPEPQDLVSRVPVAVDLHLTPDTGETPGILRKGRLEVDLN